MFLLLILIQNILQNFLAVIDVAMQTSYFFSKNVLFRNVLFIYSTEIF